MKRFSSLLFALGVTIFLLMVGMKSEAEAEACGLGGTSVVDTVTVGGCTYEIFLCVYCKYTHPGEVNMRFFRNIGGCYSTIPEDQIYNAIMAQISTYAYVFFDNCQGNLPPCTGDDRTQITFNDPICWKAKLGEITPNLIYYFYPCDDDAYCEVTYTYCMGSYGLPQHSTSNPVQYNFPYTFTTQGHEIYPLPTVLGDSTDCYIMHTPCNP